MQTTSYLYQCLDMSAQLLRLMKKYVIHLLTFKSCQVAATFTRSSYLHLSCVAYYVHLCTCTSLRYVTVIKKHTRYNYMY